MDGRAGEHSSHIENLSQGERLPREPNTTGCGRKLRSLPDEIKAASVNEGASFEPGSFGGLLQAGLGVESQHVQIRAFVLT